MALTRQDRVIAAILCGHGALGLAWTWWIGLRLCFTGTFLWTNTALALAGIVAGAGMFLRQGWAWYLSALFYAAQTVHVFNPALHFSYTLGLNAVVVLGQHGNLLGANLIAVVMFLWILFRIGARRTSP